MAPNVSTFYSCNVASTRQMEIYQVKVFPGKIIQGEQIHFIHCTESGYYAKYKNRAKDKVNLPWDNV